jgi:uncharacterized phage protein gp47/JayE
MAIFRSFSEIVNSIIERLRLTQPNLDTKPGTVARDLFIDVQADQIQKLHSSMLIVSEKQSPESATGRDLDRWANNFGISRRTGSNANGVVVFTISDISTDVSIPEGTNVESSSGLQYKTIGTYVMSVAEKNRFSATANRLRNGLNLAGITDPYAIEIPVRAMNTGSSGNISNFQIIGHTLRESVRVTNLNAFNGGANSESDSAFRARVFSVFSGSNTGTAFGYRNAALSISGVTDAIVIEPGNTLMLRDGTETIQVNDGSFRILQSGTGGKVDLYILGKQLQEVVESYVYTDKSGSGSAADERNDYILGQGSLDPTLTSEERRIKAFNSGEVPQQPVDAIISVTGSSSGVLVGKTVDADGNVSGNYELIKDTNPETGGSPFGFDKIRFIANEKKVRLESITKSGLNSVDPLRFSGSKKISEVYQDISIIAENSKISSADKSILKLNHTPVLNVSRVTNKTTGEIYVIDSQNISTATGLNSTGEIVISGKTLPSPADVLAVNYIWRLYYDKYIDYNGEFSGPQIVDKNVSNSIDWGTSNGISGEVSKVEATEDGLEYQVTVSNNISRVISVYTAVNTTGTIQNVENNEDVLVPGIIISSSNPPISNIVSVKNSNGVELYNTINADGSYYARTIVLPTDSPVDMSSTVTVTYNKIEMYDISNTDGAFANNVISLPSRDILDSNSILEDVEALELTGDDVYVDYIAEIITLMPNSSFTLFPISGSSLSNKLFTANLSTITDSNQPVFYKYDENQNITGTQKLGPTRLSLTTSGTTRPGKIKIAGETLTRLDINVTAGVSTDGLKFKLSGDIKSALGINTIPDTVGIARVDYIYSVDNPEVIPDLIGQKLSNNLYALGVGDIDSSLSNTEFILPSTSYNNSLSFSSGEIIRVSLLIYNSNDFEELYFPGNNRVITDKRFSRLSKVSVSSGFRTQAGSLSGSLKIESQNQPGTGFSYYSDYSFTAPVEGERITVRYNLNKLIIDVTSGLENVRCITADVLVKEAPLLSVDVSGEIIVNDDFTTESSTVIENVSNAVVNLLNSAALGTTIDYSDIINVVTTVRGVDSANISLFNESGTIGRRNYIKALDNQSIVAGTITFTNVSRKDFRIT